jgi:hypothetical protein
VTGAQAFLLATQVLLLAVTGFTVFTMGLAIYQAARLAWRLLKQWRGPPA